MNTVFGIHVGNSRACIAMCKCDDTRFDVEVLANNAGERVMPAIVTITENEQVVGTPCKSLLISRWNTTVTCNKRMLDRDTPDPDNGGRKVKTIIRDDEICYVLPLQDRTEEMTPSDIARCIFGSLHEIARSALPGEENEAYCVLVVPKHFSEEARIRIRAAAEAVGWDVLHIISEPSAAVLGYNLFSDSAPPPRQTLLVYRVGGKSCDTSVVQIEHGLVSALDTEYTEEVGGNRLVNILTHYLANEFFRKYKLDPKENHRSITKLILAAENCLHVLSTIESANFFVESLCDGIDFNHTMSRARFESLLNPILTEFAKPIYTVLARLNMTPNNISKVLLCGGLLKIPRLRKHISDIFQESCTKVLPLPNGINYDEVLACGAARQAGYFLSDVEGHNFLPAEMNISVLESPLIIKVEGAEFEELELESGLPLPIHRTLQLVNPQEIVTITFTQEDSEDINLMGQVRLEGLRYTVDVQLEVSSEDGIKIGLLDDTEGDNVQHFTVALYAIPTGS